MSKQRKWIVGIDEAGRGALAGPVSVGAVLVSSDFDFSMFSMVRDSKQMTPKMREQVFLEVRRAVKKGKLSYKVALTSEKIIDTKGITFAVRKGIKEVLDKLSNGVVFERVTKSSNTRRPEAKTRGVLIRTASGMSDAGNEVVGDFWHAQVEVRLDGSLYAPAEYINQKTIIKGDVTEPAISLASIMAKVTRDRKMVALSKKYPAYGLDIHKGYGTKMHREAIQKYGVSTLHRNSFCKKFM